MEPPHDHDDVRWVAVASGVSADEFHENAGLPTTNRDQSCAFCGRTRPRFAHRLDPRRVQFRVYDKGWALPHFWAVCDRCEELVVNGNDEALLRLMHENDDVAETLVQQASLTAFRAADLGSAPLHDA